MNNNIKIAVVNALLAAVVYNSAKEALAAFEAAENAAMIVLTNDMGEEVRKDLGLTRKLGAWPWYQRNEAGLKFYEGRATWYSKNPMVWTMEKGSISASAWDKAFTALMRAIGM